MSVNIEKRLTVVAVTRGVTKIWAVRDPADTHPTVIAKQPDDQRQNHFRQVPRNDNKGVERVDREYFKEIAEALKPAKEILLVGHGTGKANEAHKLREYLEQHHADVARKIVGEETTHLESMTDPEVVVLAQKWFDNPIHAH
jgi:stalled ribosome rescue protein Dom34